MERALITLSMSLYYASEATSTITVSSNASQTYQCHRMIGTNFEYNPMVLTKPYDATANTVIRVLIVPRVLGWLHGAERQRVGG